MPIARTLGNCLLDRELRTISDYGRPRTHEKITVRAPTIIANEAYQLGLMNEIVPAERLSEHVFTVANESELRADHTPSDKRSDSSS